MADDPIQHISDTAFWIAAYRAMESGRKNALFHDPLAGMLAQERGRELASSMGSAAVVAWSVAIRTHVVDDYLRTAVAEGADTILNLGAGLDTRPYRLALPSDLHWVEADYPELIAYKNERLAGEAPHCRLERIGIDLADTTARAQLLRQVDAGGRHVLVITEGVVPYLSNDEAEHLAADLAHMPHARQWITDYFSPLFMQYYHRGSLRQALGPNAPFLFEPEDWETFFRERGWALRQMRYLDEEGQRLGRPTPMPLVFRVLMRLMPAAKREAVSHMSGYALLERAEPEADTDAA
ncbi:MAG TPA: SAM-dependent methyltransferase [bacterium]|nr:SAM-dependent methyltransferase [bacterium]